MQRRFAKMAKNCDFRVLRFKINSICNIWGLHAGVVIATMFYRLNREILNTFEEKEYFS